MEDLPLPEEDIVLPDGVDMDDVQFESDVEAVHEDPDSHYAKLFNPRNGRYYEQINPGAAHYDSVDVRGALEINCAYEDCDGFKNAMVEGSIDEQCPECGASRMGRAQFSRQERSTRLRHQRVSDRAEHLHDDLAKEMRRLQDAGASSLASIDYIMCSIGEIPYEEWAAARGVSKEAVRRNISRVAKQVGEKLTFKKRGY